ncbi:chorismate mutase [Roseospira marina]|uniref:chorismate mutase n=1 Tax=Roseospira marina TaxID=140057 RepID=A0A5M6IFD2_9PROT|nr:chorismate mutase [Roseospira marina]KAA5606994.1 chorismate mutase [Roseospira marina]MBB4312824.1 chorismate mutase [Roseospira marina]MBB5086403.1 chorismate mutase [Roseospira marina]
MSRPPASLDSLRDEIDALDDQMLDLLMQRCAVVDRIAAAKQGGPILRPGREAMILRRLVGRWKGSMPKRNLVRIWRELLSGLVGVQGPFSIAVWMPERGAGYLEVARNQYGAYTPTSSHQSPSQVVREVTSGNATVGILPLPRWEDEAPWWPLILSNAPDAPHIVARLPLTGPGPMGIEALAIACMTPEQTEDDHSVLAVETGPDISRSAFTDVLTTAGLPPRAVWDARPTADDARIHVIEVRGFVQPDDTRLLALRGASDGGGIRNALLLGAYATPLPADALE